ncbi:MAG: alpha-L-fucosidase [Opitutales bacterium]
MKLKPYILAAGLLLAGSAQAETDFDRGTRMDWWREARFGMFVHWGLYSGLAGTWEGEPAPRDRNLEHIQRVVHVDTYTYAAEAIPKFTPKEDFATAWATLAKQAGCKYVVFTTKHHEGFALHDSKLSLYDAGDILNRDLVREITEALRKEDLRVGFYHSLIDWHHPQYDYTRAKYPPYPKGNIPMTTGPRDHSIYVHYLHGQVRELISNYGPVDILWWDYSSFGFDGDKAWRAGELIEICRKAHPEVIMNNRLFRRPEAGFSYDGGADLNRPLNPKFGDFGTPEQHIPEDFDPKMDWETCQTMNNTWGYSEHDLNWKSSTEIIRQLIDVVSRGGNYLLNVGPKGDGSIPEPSIKLMKDVGEWMEVNGEAIYGTSKSPIGEPDFDGRVTRKGKTYYLHLFSRPESGQVTVPFNASQAQLLDGNLVLELKQTGKSVTIELPKVLPDSVASVIRIR